MLINGNEYRTIWISDDKQSVEIIDQRYIPFELEIESIRTVEEMAVAIKDMHLRGAPLIGAAAGFGMYLATLYSDSTKNFDDHLERCEKMLEQTRPTAINLKWALKRQHDEISRGESLEEKQAIALRVAQEIADEDVAITRNIGVHGVSIIEELSKAKNGEVVNILTHCNAGALACVDNGTATSPIYEAHRRNIPIHVWVDETRPRNQGKLTAWELQQSGISCTVLCDNTGGHMMQHGLVDMVIVGTDRTTANGDVANKIGTYLKALAAKDNNIPFYVALPYSTIDWTLESGKDIPIEERTDEEVLYMEGLVDGAFKKVQLFSNESKALNYGFDVTPARLVTGLITERGICEPSKLKELYKD